MLQSHLSQISNPNATPVVVNNSKSSIVFSALCAPRINSSHWILDYSASCHISSSLTNFTDIKPTFNHCVQLPDQTKIQVHFVGTIVLTPDIILHNVYCVPYFKFNLLSVSSLLHDSNYSITFTSDSFSIQDNRTLRMIGGVSL